MAGLNPTILCLSYRCGSKGAWPIIAVRDLEPIWFKAALKLLRSVLSLVNQADLLVSSAKIARYTKRTGKSIQHWYPGIISGLSIARYVRSHPVDYVWAEQLYINGYAAALCNRFVPSYVRVWGGDVYDYPDQSQGSNMYVRRILRSVRGLACSSHDTKAYIVNRWNISKDKVSKYMPMQLDRALGNANIDRVPLRTSLGIRSDAFVVFNCRRFLKTWGCEVFTDVACEFAMKNMSAHFVVIGGPGSKTHVEDLKRRIAGKKIEAQFTIFDDAIPVEKFLQICRACDVAISLRTEKSNLSGGILEASCFAVPIIGDQESDYDQMMLGGFDCERVASNDVGNIMEALVRCLDKREIAGSRIASNREYLQHHFSRECLTRRLREILALPSE